MVSGIGTTLLVYFLLGIYAVNSGNVDLVLFLVAVAFFINMLGNSLKENYVIELIKFYSRKN